MLLLLVAQLHERGRAGGGRRPLCALAQPLVVQDLLAVIRFVLQPEDNLSLACILVSRPSSDGRRISFWNMAIVDEKRDQPVAAFAPASSSIASEIGTASCDAWTRPIM